MDVPDPDHVSSGGDTGEIPGLCLDQSHGCHRRGLPCLDYQGGAAGLEGTPLGVLPGGLHGGNGVPLVYEDEEGFCGCDLRD